MNTTQYKFSDLWNALKYKRYQEAFEMIKIYIRDITPMLLFTAGYFICYLWAEHMPRLRYTNIHVALDDYIPFCEYFIIPYLLWFVYMIGNVLFLFFCDRENYHKTATMIYLGGTLFVVVSILWPNIQYLRLSTMPRDNIFTHMVQNLWNTDTPTNLCPSIHVFHTMAVMLGIFHSHKTNELRSPLYRVPMYVLGVLIILSTMFIKQHSVFDVVCAFVCIAVGYILVYQYDFSLSGEGNTVMAAIRERREKRPHRSFIH